LLLLQRSDQRWPGSNGRGDATPARERSAR
jgi:hypothetical protein